VIGIGPGNGEAITRRLAADGFAVAMLSRKTDLSSMIAKELTGSLAIAADAADSASLGAGLDRVVAELGPIHTLVYNAGSGAFGTALDVTPAQLEASLRVNAVGALVAAQRVAPAMLAAGEGNIVFIGATASLRGNVKTAAFAPAKAAQRSLAQSLAKLLGPKGVHVSLVVVDGVIDLPRTRAAMSDKPESFFLKPADIAGVVSHLVQQPRSAWTFEMDVRPFGESW
jgi:NAD(P)-dependent dehydrogenase (short-subunit alcohol dehydrogenase family)